MHLPWNQFDDIFYILIFCTLKCKCCCNIFHTQAILNVIRNLKSPFRYSLTRVWVFNTIGIFNTFKMVLAIGIFNTFDIFVKLKYWYWIHSFYSDQYPILFISEFSMFFVFFWGSLKENWFLLSIMEIWQMKTLKNSYYCNWISLWLILRNVVHENHCHHINWKYWNWYWYFQYISNGKKYWVFNRIFQEYWYWVFNTLKKYWLIPWYKVICLFDHEKFGPFSHA